MIRKTFSQLTRDQIHCAVALFPLLTLILISLDLSYSSPWSSGFMYLEKKSDIPAFSFYFYYFACRVPT